VVSWVTPSRPSAGHQEASMAKKVLGWIVLALVIFYIVRDPAAAATTTKHIGSGLATMASGIGDFFTRVISGK
jgi:hypothetical protein